MTKSKWLEPARLELVVAVLIAIVSLTTALAAWRTSSVGSIASDANHKGLINAVKKQAAQDEDWRSAYEQAGYAREWAVTLSGIQSLEKSGDPAAVERAGVMRQFLLPGLVSLAGPFATNDHYIKSDGSFDIDKLFTDLEAESSDLAGLNPEASFKLASIYYNEQRWLVIGTVLMALSLFWLGMAQIGWARLKLLTSLIGTALYTIGVAWFVVVEIVFFIIRTGKL